MTMKAGMLTSRLTGEDEIGESLVESVHFIKADYHVGFYELFILLVELLL
jgi:hypothetical protein